MVVVRKRSAGLRPRAIPAASWLAWVKVAWLVPALAACLAGLPGGTNVVVPAEALVCRTATTPTAMTAAAGSGAMCLRMIPPVFVVLLPGRSVMGGCALFRE